MSKPNEYQRVQELWERGVEHASENMQHPSGIDAAQLNQVASLRIRTGFRSGRLGAGADAYPLSDNCTLFCPE